MDTSSNHNNSPDKWSPNFKKCRICHKNSVEHYGGGYCIDCYPKTKEYLALSGYMEGISLSEVGRNIGLSRERVRQLFEKAVKIDLDRIDPNMLETKQDEYRAEIENAHKQNMAERDFGENIRNNYKNIISKLLETDVIGEAGLLRILNAPPSAMHLINDQYPEFIKIINLNKEYWASKAPIIKKVKRTEKTNHREKWMKGMMKKLGVETEAEVREFMKKSGSKAVRSNKGGFAYLKQNNPVLLNSISKKGGKYRHGLK